MNAQAIIDQAMERYRDIGGSTIARTIWLGYLNDTQRRFVKQAKFPLTRGSTDVTFPANTASMALPAGIYSVSAIHDLTNDRRVVPTEFFDRQGDYYPERDTDTGEPETFYITGNSIFLLPIPNTETIIRVWTNGQLTDLTDGSGSTPVIPEHYHAALTNGMLHLAYLDNIREQGENAIAAARMYGDLFSEAVDDARREFAAPAHGRYVPARKDYFTHGDRGYRGGR